ncbi:MAG: precorrin-6y C5,15-methyltransferase (decarboxylating) subunit CbiE [Eubacteriaceae bacterium]|jgi:cobalt-precorrin-7 (C5)-methyltransferase|nr:precorrin-6y C5,15-methyltransferase (decarboxylating) subunit CbiE [Eubacteriaceae bacterium]
MHSLKVIGLGPGHPDYILPIAKKEIAKAQLILCGKRHLESFDHRDKELLTIGEGTPLKDLMLSVAARYRETPTAIVVSGDTGFYSLLSYAKRMVPEKDIVTIPGISSLQYFFAKLNKTWQDAKLISMHGRETNLLKAVLENTTVGILTDDTHHPAHIAKTLVDAGINNKIIHIGEDLSYPEERITSIPLSLGVSYETKGMSVVVIADE